MGDMVGTVERSEGGVSEYALFWMWRAFERFSAV